MEYFNYSWEDFESDIESIKLYFYQKHLKFDCVFGIPKGGLPLAVKLANTFNIPLYTSLKKARRDFSDKSKILLVDDICDSGKTLLKIKDIDDYYTLTLLWRYNSKYKPNMFIARLNDDRWCIFPWEDKLRTIKVRQGTYKGDRDKT